MRKIRVGEAPFDAVSRELEEEFQIFDNDEFESIEKDMNLVFKWFPIRELLGALIKPDFFKEIFLNNNLDEVMFILSKK